MDEDEPVPHRVEIPLGFRLGSRLVIAKKAERLDPRQTVYRLELEQPYFLALIQPVLALCPWIKSRWPEWFLPPIIILKKQKVGWEKEFDTEKKAYDLLKAIQGTVIPKLYGAATYDASPALILSAITGSTLFDLTRSNFPQSKDKTLREQLKKALNALWLHGVEYTDQKLDNFLVVDDGRVMVVDLELVEFNTAKVWEESINCAGVSSLMHNFMSDREPNRMPPASLYFPPDK